MHCKSCNYPLWQLSVRQCPECGAPFKPSDFEFTLNAVRFCCPHCEQAYYGTGPMGHLQPRTFNCVSCGRAVDMDQMVLLPTEGVSDHQTTATAISWANRRDKGWFKAFFTTMGLAMGNPNRCIDAVPEGSSVTLAIVYMTLHVIPQILLSGGVLVFFALGVTATAGRGAAMGMIAAALGAVIGAPLLVLLWASLIHVLLAMTGPTRGIGRTVQAICYGAGNNFVGLVPCLGFYLSFLGAIWWSIASAFMLARAHGVRAWRVAIALVIPTVLVFALAVGGFVAMTLSTSRRTSAVIAASMPGMPSVYGTPAEAGQRMASVLDLSGHHRPAHPADLLLDRAITPQEFVLAGSNSDTLSCTVQNLTLNQLGFGAGNAADRQALMADPALSGPACRVGDFVFTYAGIADPAPSGRLWLAIGWPDPALNKADPQEVVLVLPNAMSKVISAGEFDAELDAQNVLRKQHDLAALPHPRTVKATTSKKAVNTYGPGGYTYGAPVPPGTKASGQGEMFGGRLDPQRLAQLAGALRGPNKPVAHIAEVMSNESITAYELMDGSELSGGGQVRRMAKVPFGSSDLQAYLKMKPEAKREQEKLAAEGIDPKTIAYRIGDTVFTHRGLDPALIPYGSRQRALWVAIGWPEIMTVDAADPDRRVHVGLADGSTRSFRIDALDQELADQNALRREFGLEDLPKPEEVTAGTPALGSKPPKMTGDKP